MVLHIQDVYPRNSTELERVGDVVLALRSIVLNEIQGFKKAAYIPVQVQYRIGCLKPTELHSMACYNLKAGFVLPYKAEMYKLNVQELNVFPHFSKLIFPI